MANMTISPFLKSAAVVLAKRAIVGLLNSATFAEFSSGDQCTERDYFFHRSKKYVLTLGAASGGNVAGSVGNVAGCEVT